MRWSSVALLVCIAFAATKAGAEDALEQRSQRGPVEVVVRLTPAMPRIGDSLIFEIEVQAESSIELLMPEFGEALDRFAIVDFAPNERIAEDGPDVLTRIEGSH